VFMVAAATFRMSRPPRVVGGLGMLHGYFKSMIQRKPRYGDSEFRAFLRRYQWSVLLKGKARAVAELNKSQAVRWNPRVK
jgi:biofilm PGA synthesis N-glycosyltransferase PgaC